MDFNKLSNGKKIILVSAAVMVLSLFMPWVKFSFISVSGFKSDGYIFCLAFAYPAYAILKEELIQKINVNIAVASINTVLLYLFIQSKKVAEFGIKIDATGTGSYIALLSCMALVVGLFIYSKEQKSQ